MGTKQLHVVTVETLPWFVEMHVKLETVEFPQIIIMVGTDRVEI